MIKDISEYISFENEGGFNKVPLKTFLGKSIIVHEWKELESHYADGNKSGKYVKMVVEYEGVKSFVNTGSSIIMEQLAKISEAKKAINEEDASFSCVLKKCGNGVKFYPNNFEEKK